MFGDLSGSVKKVFMKNIEHVTNECLKIVIIQLKLIF